MPEVHVLLYSFHFQFNWWRNVEMPNSAAFQGMSVVNSSIKTELLDEDDSI